VVEPLEFPGFPVVQFRSVPYATIPKRFSPSVPLRHVPSVFDGRPSRDFTNYGAACPQIGGAHPSWCDPYGGPLQDDLNLEFDEFTCLTVSISVPESQLVSDTATKLPVMVYVHGGGMSEGIGHVDGLHSNAPITSYAASISQPVIAVNIGYRLGWFGSLVCEDVLDEFTANPTSPYGPFNLGMQDQRNAFAWIHTFIGGFGGDPFNITAFGESAGSVFLAYHICGSSARLFDQAILQSGLIFGNVPFEVKEAEYQTMLKHLGIDKQTAPERLDALRQVDTQTLLMLPGCHMTPYVDPVPGVSTEASLFSRGTPTVLDQMDLIATCDWLGDVIIGDDFWEGQLFFPLLQACAQSEFAETVRSLFPTSEAESLLAAYQLPSKDDHRGTVQISLLLGDLMFSAPCHELGRRLANQSEGRKRNVYRYSFCLSNPFPGSICNFAPGHHFVEILFLFLTLQERYPTHRDGWAARQARGTARRWIAFANGRAPWDPCFTDGSTGEDEARIAICDDLSGWSVRTIKEDEELSKKDPWGERRYAAWRAISRALDSLRNGPGDAISRNHRLTMTRLRLLQFAYGSSGLLKVSGLEPYTNLVA
jgi:carboxylesterase type B